MVTDATPQERGRRSRRLGKAAEATEFKWWGGKDGEEGQGFRVQKAGFRVQFLGGGKRILVPWDLFGKYDLSALYPSWPTAMALVQVTREPFYHKVDAPKKGRGAGHGEPVFEWPVPTVSVDDWIGEVQTGSLDPEQPAFVQVLVSYSDPRKPERRWWDPLERAKSLADAV